MLRVPYFFVLVSAVTLAGSLTFEDVISTIDNGHIQSIPSLLSALSSKHPDFFQRFTLARESRSAQESDPENPRAIVFGEDATFILTFNGKSTQRGYDVLEMMQFRESKYGGKFEFREIEFSHDGKVKISDADPIKCQRCHAFPLRPIWNPYDHWPGMYGEFDDVIAGIEVPNSSPSTSRIDFMNRQVEEYRNFLSKKETHERYRYLKMHSLTPFPPYNDKERSGGENVRPNLHLTHRLTRLYSKVITSRVFEAVNTNRYQPALLGLILDCRREREFEERWNGVAKFFAREAESQFSSARYLGGRDSSSDTDSLLRVFRLLGIESESLTMASPTNSWVFFEGGNSLEEIFAGELYTQMAKADSALKPFQARLHSGYEISFGSSEPTMGYGAEPSPSESVYGEPESADPEEYRRILTQRELSCRHLLELAEARKLERMPSPQPPLQTRVVKLCQSCHSMPGVPAIPFDNAVELRHHWRDRILERISAPQRQMPPDRRLTEQERLELEKYLSE